MKSVSFWTSESEPLRDDFFALFSGQPEKTPNIEIIVASKRRSEHHGLGIARNTQQSTKQNGPKRGRCNSWRVR